MLTEKPAASEVTDTNDAQARAIKPVAPLDITKQKPAVPPPPRWINAETVNVFIRHSHYTKARQVFTVFDADGAVMIDATNDPEHDACRLLYGRGVRGWLVTRWADAPHYGSRLGIEWGARHRIVDGETVGPIRRKLAPSEVAKLPVDQREALLASGFGHPVDSSDAA